MSKKKDYEKVKNAYYHQNHKKPMTRRDLMAQGFITGSGLILAPTLLSQVFQNAYAESPNMNCDLGLNNADRNNVAFMAFDLAGGANIAGSNVLVGGKGGQQDFLSQSAYKTIGLGSGEFPTDPSQVRALGVDSSEDLPNNVLLYPKRSKFFEGFNAATTMETRKNCNGSLMCVQSAFDTNKNPHNPVYGIVKAAALANQKGKLTQIIGNNASKTGGNAVGPNGAPLLFESQLMPTQITSFEGVKTLVSGGDLNKIFSKDDSVKIMRKIETLSQEKMNKITDSDLVKSHVMCQYQRTTYNAAQFEGADKYDLFSDKKLTNIINQNSNLNGVKGSDGKSITLDSKFVELTSSVMKLVIGTGDAKAGVVSLSGYDYHYQQRSWVDKKDWEAGFSVGMAVQYAAENNQPLMVYVFTDGGVAGGANGGQYNSDSPYKCGTLMLVYDPKGRPVVNPNTKTREGHLTQIGGYNNAGNVDITATPIANSVELSTYAVILNYMALLGIEDEFRAKITNKLKGMESELTVFNKIIT